MSTTTRKATPKDQTVGTRVSWPAMKWEGRVITADRFGVIVRWDGKPNDLEVTDGRFSGNCFTRDLLVIEGATK